MTHIYIFLIVFSQHSFKRCTVSDKSLGRAVTFLHSAYFFTFIVMGIGFVFLGNIFPIIVMLFHNCKPVYRFNSKIMWPKLMAKFLQLLKTAHWDEIKYREKGNLKNIMFFYL